MSVNNVCNFIEFMNLKLPCLYISRYQHLPKKKDLDRDGIMHVLTQQNLYFTVSAEVRMKYKSFSVSHSKAFNLEG